MLSGTQYEVEPSYLRAQAELCFAMARLVSDPDAAKLARLAAERYMRRADNAEKRKIAHRAAIRNSG
jgi:hypothetical protein